MLAKLNGIWCRRRRWPVFGIGTNFAVSKDGSDISGLTQIGKQLASSGNNYDDFL